MKKKILLTLLILLLAISSLFSETFNYTAYSSIYFHILQMPTLYPSSSIAARLGTLTVDGSDGYGTATGIRVKSNFPGNVVIEGERTGWFGGNQSNLTCLVFIIQEVGGGTTYKKIGANQDNQTIDLVTFTSGSTKSYVIDVYVTHALFDESSFVQGEYYSLTETGDSTIQFYEKTGSGWFAGTGSEIPVGGITGGVDLINDTVVGEEGGSTFGEEDLAAIDILFKVEDADTIDDLNELNQVEVAYIHLWGDNITDEVAVNVKFVLGAGSHDFCLAHQNEGSNEEIPYKMWANSEEISANYTLVNKPVVTKNHTSEALCNRKAVIIKAKLDLSTQQLQTKPAGTYQDIIYIQVSLDR